MMSGARGLVAGRYRLREPVGAGGMGRVWLAWDETLRRDVAIKEVVPPDWLAPAERSELRERTLREARAAAQLNHPNVVKIYDVVHSEEWPWIVMEYIPSRSLQQVIKADGPVPPQRAAAIGLAVLDALTAAHEAGVLHRDVKPHNVLIGADGRVVLTDFGLATLDADGAITRADVVMGSPQYIAPERARFGTSSQQTDMWSLGATLYAAVEGRSPYARSSPMATLSALAIDPPDPTRLAGPLTPVLAGLLCKDPQDRLSHAEVATMLRQVVAGTGGSRPVGSARRRQRALTAMAVLAGVIAAVTIATMVAGESTGPAAPTTTSPVTAHPPAQAADVRRCDQPPSTGTPVPPTGTGPPRTSGGSVPVAPMPGWSWYHDTAGGFFIAVPPDWTVYHRGATVCFLDPLGFRVLGVNPARPPTDDPVGAAAREAEQLVESGQLPGYRRVALRPRAFATAGAEWEFSFDSEAGRRHAVSWIITSPNRTYSVFWVTPEVEWQPSLAFPFGAISTFRPM